jgi:hypothetical protein
MGLAEVFAEAFMRLVDATAAAAMAACFRNSRRFIVCLQGME